MRKSLVLALTSLCLACPAVAQTCGPDPVPSPAAAHGFTCEVFWDDFTSSSTVDLRDTRAPGFKWYIHNQWPGLAAGATGWQTFTPTPPGDITFVAGGMQILPSLNTPLNGVNIMSCATNGVANQYVGTAIQGGMYIDVQVTSYSPPGQVGGNYWWVALWAIGVNFLSAVDPSPATLVFPEVDFHESLGDGRELHHWIANGGGSTDIHTGYSSTTYSAGITFETLILPPELNGGTGTVVGYANDVISGGTPATWSPGGTYSTTTTVPLCFAFTSGYNQALILRSFKVFAAPPPSGGGRPRRGLR